MTEAATSGQGSFKRRDALLEYQKEVAQLWEERKPFEIDAAPSSDESETFFVTFPFPYMNGRLHLGHAFSMTKAEFTARFQRLMGKRVLWPFGFHCTGMPIAACADKLRNELEDAAAGAAAIGSNVDEEDQAVEVELTNTQTFTGRKSKAVAKTGAGKTQWEILEDIGVPTEEIPKFVDADYWLRYFPPIGQADLKLFGISADWRRSFITTDVNPYFDRFVKWQYRLLLERGRVKFGLRPAIFSRIDNQPCADHDRAAGEGSNPQEYTLLKLRLSEVPSDWVEKCPQLRDARVYLVAATLRPETMYAQTNCFVLPSGVYSVVPAFERQLDMKEIVADRQRGYVAVKTMTSEEVKETIRDYYVCSDRSAANMAYQGIVPAVAAGGHSAQSKYAEPHVVMEVRGEEMIGLQVRAPLSLYETIYVLPLPTIKMDKGSGVVTSVPSDSPDDYAMYKDLQTKAKLRAELKVKEEWVARDILEVIEVSNSRRIAADLCEEMKVSSHKDETKLKELKALTYTKGFYEGVMITGPYTGRPVREAKDLVKADLIQSGDALKYFEPEKKVISRSGDDCVVALCNQWYSDFGDPEWTAMVLKHLENPQSFNAYGQRSAYISVANWLEGWACSRNYGLGTLLPWEAEQGNRVLIESLSDSTIYFAYYTVCHFWQSNIYGAAEGDGSGSGLLNIKPEDLRDAEFNYIFCQTDEMPSDSSISPSSLRTMREAFEYWYPMNLRVSGKDLVPNHLTMSLFHHAAIWPHRPDLWPRGFYVNGHLMLDGNKMSKSTGNFLTIVDAVQQYTSDATRLALADAGDSVDDANFERLTANGCLMKLYVLVQFVQELVAKVTNDQSATPLYQGPKRTVDEMFENECIDRIIKARQAYEALNMRDALKFGFYELNSLKDVYRTMLPPTEEFHIDSIFKWIRWLTIVASPMAPFTMEYINSVLLKKTETAVAKTETETAAAKTETAKETATSETAAAKTETATADLIVNARWPIEIESQFNGPLHRKFQLLMSFAEDQRRALEKLMAPPKKSGKGGSAAAAAPAIDRMTVYVAAEYLPWQQEVLKVLQRSVEIDETANVPKDPKYIEIVKNSPEIQAMDNKTMKLALGFASYQIKEELRLRGVSALSLQLGFDEAEWLKANEEYLLRVIGGSGVSLKTMQLIPWTEQMLNETKKPATPGKPIVLFSSSS